MKDLFAAGDKKYFSHQVTQADTASFQGGEVHPVYATFALGRDAEWCCRLFVLDMKEDDEEGIGTFLTVNHHSPALIDSIVDFEATVKSISGNEIICSYAVKTGDRLIATGEQGQKILKKEKVKRLFESLG